MNTTTPTSSPSGSVASATPIHRARVDSRSHRAPLDANLCPPPSAAADVCPTCRDWKAQSMPSCVNCERNTAQLQTDPILVRALTLYSRTSPIRSALSGYKNPLSEHHLTHRTEIHRLLRLLVDDLISNGLGSDAVCVVPSTAIDRIHPLDVIARQTRHLSETIRPLRRGFAELGHNKPHPDGYISSSRLDDQQILILDDVYTTGARSQSAAHALARAGATISCIAVIGRRINPDASPELVEWSRRHGLTTPPAPS